jgi:hypothetical protein
MNAHTFSRLMEISILSDAERDAAFDRAQSEDVRDYLEILNGLSRLHIPAPSASRKWGGRLQLLDAVQAYRQPAASGRRGLFAWLRLAPAAVASGAVLTVSLAAGAIVTQTHVADRPFTQVLSALGVHSQPPARPAADGESPSGPPENVPVLYPGFDIDTPAPSINETPDPPEIPAPVPEETAGGLEQQGQGVDPPGQGGANPGQGVDPPGQGGASPGQGVEPPGQGGENPGQGVDPVGPNGENPGQGLEPPGPGGANSGQGIEPPGPTEDPGQGVDPPGQGSENPGQGQGNKP